MKGTDKSRAFIRRVIYGILKERPIRFVESISRGPKLPRGTNTSKLNLQLE